MADQPVPLAELQKLRGSIRSMFTRAYNDLTAELKKEEPERKKILTDFRRLSNQYEKLLVFNSKVQDAMLREGAAQEEHDKEAESCEKYENHFCEMQTEYAELDNKEDTFGTASEKSHSTVGANTNYRLPKLEFDPFGGDPRDWIKFWSQFSIVHDDDSLPYATKFHYLRNATVPGSKAREIVDSFPPKKENYDKCIAHLKERFGKDETLKEIYVRELLQNALQTVQQKLPVEDLYDKLETQLRALESLGVARETHASLLYPLVEAALEEDILKVWERKLSSAKGKGQTDKLTALMEFLEIEVQSDIRSKQAKAAFKPKEDSEKSKKSGKPQHHKKKSDTPTATDLSNTTQKKKRNCIFCDKTHKSQDCFTAQKMTLAERKAKASEKNACFGCLIPGHRARDCRGSVKCVVCGGKHYPIMCPDLEDQKSSSSSSGKKGGSKFKKKSESSEGDDEQGESSMCNTNCGGIYLQTLKVKMSGPDGAFRVRLDFDTGSMKSYITKRAANAVGAKKCGEVTLTHNLFGGGELRRHKHNEYQVRLSNLNGKYSKVVTLLDQEKICGYIDQIRDEAIIEECKSKGIILTDVYRGKEWDIHILIGVDLMGEFVTGRIERLSNGVVATETLLGWTLMGPHGKRKVGASSLFVTSLMNGFDIQDLWKLDVLGILDEAETKSKEELIQASMNYFNQTVKQNTDGRYVVALPWIEHHPPVPVNRKLAEGRLKKEMEGRLKSAETCAKYSKIFEDWELDGIIEEVKDKMENCSHLPHRPVFNPKSKTTPMRPVFDASAKARGGVSLNQCLGKGVNLIELIPNLILLFRIGKYAVLADIRKAFLQILVREEDRDFLRFLWWHEIWKILKIYRHCRVVFGLTSSPFLLAAVIIFHLSQERFRNNPIAQILMKSFYVDNLITSLRSIEEVQQFIKESTEIMMQARFELRDWTWNDPAITRGPPVSLLGMQWFVHTDTIAIDVQSLASMDEKKPITKRNVLSACHRIFDPIGFTCPATIKIKKMVQDAWRKNKSWDEPLDEEMQARFAKWRKKAVDLEQIRVPRWILPIEGKKTLHVFCDASGVAYATVIFLRVENASMTTLRFIDARNRLAQIKRMTIPRLELLACLIGARLAANAQELLGDNIEDTVYWTDSSTALYWIQRQESWATFVQNRVKDIKSLSNVEKWTHIAGVDNPADLPSRGCSPTKLVKSSWWEGPEWLLDSEENWPKSSVNYDIAAINEERIKSVVSAFVAKKPEEDPWYLNLYENKRQVTLPQMLRVIAWMLRMKQRKYGGDIIMQEELDEAEKSLIRIVQHEMISAEDPKVKALHAYRDKEDDIWRVKTKILNRDDDESFRLPILLPAEHPITKLIVETVHKNLFHCGVQTLQSTIRERFWIPKARMLIRHVVHTCPRCRRWEAKRAEVPEAPLPPERVRDAVAFEVTGIDLGGPLYLENGDKAWFVLFTCAVYRAAHIELVTSLSTKALMGALERFVARRGCPAVIFSDNGTNLVGVRNELIRVNSGIKWKLNPPASPWWGGWFERIIGMTKKLIRRILGRRVADYEEMMTILTNCERVINARPLTYLAEDNEDLIPLTPEMFLREIKTEGEIDLNDLDCDFGENYKKRKDLLKQFRKRFRSEYLGLLVHRDNRKRQKKLKVGDIVLVEVDNQKQIHWPMGRIVEVHEGAEDGRRFIAVQTKSGIIKRAAQRLFPLEVPQEDIQEIEKEIEQESAVEIIQGKPEVQEKAAKEKGGRVFTRSGREIKLPLKLK